MQLQYTTVIRIPEAGSGTCRLRPHAFYPILAPGKVFKVIWFTGLLLWFCKTETQRRALPPEATQSMAELRPRLQLLALLFARTGTFFLSLGLEFPHPWNGLKGSASHGISQMQSADVCKGTCENSSVLSSCLTASPQVFAPALLSVHALHWIGSGLSISYSGW